MESEIFGTITDDQPGEEQDGDAEDAADPEIGCPPSDAPDEVVGDRRQNGVGGDDAHGAEGECKAPSSDEPLRGKDRSSGWEAPLTDGSKQGEGEEEGEEPGSEGHAERGHEEKDRDHHQGRARAEAVEAASENEDEERGEAGTERVDQGEARGGEPRVLEDLGLEYREGEGLSWSRGQGQDEGRGHDGVTVEDRSLAASHGGP